MGEGVGICSQHQQRFVTFLCVFTVPDWQVELRLFKSSLPLTCWFSGTEVLLKLQFFVENYYAPFANVDAVSIELSYF